MKHLDSRDELMARAMEGSGQRLTRQKTEVFHYMQKNGIHHPTAEEIYFGVKKAIPSISLATVYNCLESLVGCSLLRRVDIPGSPHHYEMRGREHDHFRCVDCGKIFDLEPQVSVKAARMPAEFEVTDYQLLFAGHCPTCKKK